MSRIMPFVGVPGQRFALVPSLQRVIAGRVPREPASASTASSLGSSIVDTDVTRKMIPPDRSEVIDSIAKLGRVATPEDVVACALYLASDESTILTGTEIVVGGGNSLLAPQLENVSHG